MRANAYLCPVCKKKPTPLPIPVPRTSNVKCIVACTVACRGLARGAWPDVFCSSLASTAMQRTQISSKLVDHVFRGDMAMDKTDLFSLPIKKNWPIQSTATNMCKDSATVCKDAALLDRRSTQHHFHEVIHKGKHAGCTLTSNSIEQEGLSCQECSFTVVMEVTRDYGSENSVRIRNSSHTRNQRGYLRR